MSVPPKILIADDNPMNVSVLQTHLSAHGYDILTAADGAQALTVAREQRPDLVLLDVVMPEMDGFEVCRRLKADAALHFVPVIIITAKTDPEDTVAGLEAGGDEYLTKPVDPAALVARVKSMLRIKALHDTVREQAARLHTQAAQLAEWNRTLEQRVVEQVQSLERLGRLRRFLSPQVAEIIVSSGDERALESHRREITVVFCDLRGFTPFAESAEPEEVMGILREFHSATGDLIYRFEGTLERFAGDGFMVFFNDPFPCRDPAARAVQMAVAIRGRVSDLIECWRKRGHRLDFGAGIAQGFATLGRIGFEGRFDYGAIGTVTNLASRLCDTARPEQILISERVYAAVEGLVEVEPAGDLPLRGFAKPVPAYNVVRLRGTVA